MNFFFFLLFIFILQSDLFRFKSIYAQLRNLYLRCRITGKVMNMTLLFAGPENVLFERIVTVKTVHRCFIIMMHIEDDFFY